MCAGPVRFPHKIAVIGGTGFIGQRLIRLLRAEGREVRAVIRPGSARRSAIPAGVEVCEARLDRSDPQLAAALHAAEAVVYAAGTVRGWALADFLPANVQGLEAVAGILGPGTPARPLIVVSSLAAGQPQLSDYARSKRMGEEVLAQTPANLAWTILRPTAVYGPGDRELRPLFALMRRGVFPGVGGPQQRLSFVHVNDLARALLAAIDHAGAVVRQTHELDDGTAGGYDQAALAAALRPRGPALRVSVPRPLLAMLAATNLRWSRWIRRPPMLTPGKVAELTHPRWVGDNRAFTAATGWTPRFDLASGTQALFRATSRR